MSVHGPVSILTFLLTSTFTTAAPSLAQEIRCIHGCTLLDEEQALRDAGLDRRDCDAAVRLEIASDGSVVDVSFLRLGENEKCNQTLAAFARQTRWSAAPDVAPRTMSLSWSNDLQRGVAGKSREAEFHTYPGGMGLDSDRGGSMVSALSSGSRRCARLRRSCARSVAIQTAAWSSARLRWKALP